MTGGQTLTRLADLLGRDKSTVSRHIAKVFAEGELIREAVVAVHATTAANAGSVSHRDAVAKAEGEYAAFRAAMDAGESDVERAYLAAVKDAQKRTEGTDA